MKGLELLEAYPKAAEVVKDFYFKKLMDSLDISNIDESYKEFVKAQDFDNRTIGAMIDGNSRMLFDVFDDNKIYIQTTVALEPHVEPRFNYSVSDETASTGSTISFGSRIEAEKKAIELAFEILNNKL